MPRPAAPSKPVSFETSAGSIYDYPVYYDVIFGPTGRRRRTSWKLQFEKHAQRTVKSVFEPACGDGRILIKLGERGYKVSGNDLNPKAVDYCTSGWRKPTCPDGCRGDMSDFQLKKPVDAAFNLINTVRHLPTEEAMPGRISSGMADALAPGESTCSACI